MLGIGTFLSLKPVQCNTGFPIKDTHFSKLKNIPGLVIDDNEGKIEENID